MKSSYMRGQGRLPLILLLVAALAAGLGLYAGQRYFAPAPALQNTLLYPEPRALPEFSLQTAADSDFTLADLRGHWTLVFIGFTHCPDICPTTLADLARVEAAMADLPVAQQPRVLFVSVDPERDTPERAADYAQFFGPDMLAATAPHEALEPFTRSLGLVYMQVPQGDGYTVDHSARIAVINPEAELVGLITPPLDSVNIEADLRRLVSDG